MNASDAEKSLENVDFLFLPLRGEYLSLCGAAGLLWLQSVQSDEVFRIAKELDRAIQLLRKHQLGAGISLIASLVNAVENLPAMDPSIPDLLRRYLFAVRAYAYYLTGDLDEASHSLQQAHDFLVRVIDRHFFLAPFAIHFIDFLIQTVRIARRENRWKDVKHYMDRIHRIYGEDYPFCELAGGKPLRMSDLRAFFQSLPLDEQQQATARLILGDNTSVEERLELLEEQIFALPDFVIPYP